MTLQILVNHYKENVQIITNFLASLESQKGVDFEVIICSDGADRLDESFLNQFNLNITYKYLPHGGMCHTRNILLDMSTADYIMFCDIDDCFISPDGLMVLMAIAEQCEADIIGSPYLVENLVNNEYFYEVLRKDIIRIHGKIFKRQYLIEQNICFPDEIEITGDMMFLWLAYKLTQKIAWTQNIFYLWKFNPNSLTRQDPLAYIHQYKDTIWTYTLTAREIKKRNIMFHYNQLICNTIYMAYLDTTSQMWQKIPQKELIEMNTGIINFLKEFYEDYKKIDIRLKKIYFNFMKEYKTMYKTSGDFDGVDKWIDDIINKDIGEI